MDFHLVFRFRWHLKVRVGGVGLKCQTREIMKSCFPLNGNGTTLTFAPHKDLSLTCQWDCNKTHRPAHQMLDCLTSNILSTSFFSKEMTLSQTINRCFQGCELHVPLHLRCLLSSQTGLLCQACPLRLTGPHWPTMLNSPLKLKLLRS